MNCEHDYRHDVISDMAKAIMNMSELTGVTKIYRMPEGDIEIFFDNKVVAYIDVDDYGWLAYCCACVEIEPALVKKLYELAKGEVNYYEESGS